MLVAAGRDRGADQRRARPPRRLRLAAPSSSSVYREFLAGAPQAVIWDRPELLALREGPLVAYDVPDATLDGGRASFAWDGVDGRARTCRASTTRATPPPRWPSRGWSASLRRRSRRAGGLRAARRGASSASAPAPAAPRSTTTTPTTRPRSRRRSRRARTLGPQRLVAAFQPHLYSRTRALAREFGAALAARRRGRRARRLRGARARARTIPGVSGLLVAEATADAAAGGRRTGCPTAPRAEQLLERARGRRRCRGRDGRRRRRRARPARCSAAERRGRDRAPARCLARAADDGAHRRRRRALRRGAASRRELRRGARAGPRERGARGQRRSDRARTCSSPTPACVAS